MGKKKKRKGNGGERSIHPRNKYAVNPPNFSLLASIYPSFSPFVFYSFDNKPRINWTDFNATRELTRVLLHHDHSLNWWIPDGQLCPTVPNRSNYIHWIEDLLASDVIEKNNVDGNIVRGFDIGTGANCIYPLLGAALLGWSFVGSDITDVALEWAEKNVKSNPHISHLIELRRVDVAQPACGNDTINDGRPSDECQKEEDYNDLVALKMREFDESTVSCSEGRLDSCVTSENIQKEEEHFDLAEHETKEFDESAVTTSEGRFENKHLVDNKEVEALIVRRDGEAQAQSLCHSDETCGYHGPSVLLGVVKEGEKFDFCMCNPPFFESMEESGLNPKTSCGGTPEEMVCPGGERAFISRIIEDSVKLKQSFRWYTSMIGKKSNLKVLISRLREVGVTIVKTTEFVQGQTSRWGLAWSFMPPARKLIASHMIVNSNPSFMLEGLHHRTSAFDVLQSVESFFNYFGASCKSNSSSFTVDVSASKDHFDTILKTDVKKLDEVSICLPMNEASTSANCSNSPTSLSFRILVFQQIPGTLLVKASLQLRDSPLSGVFTSVIQRLEEFLKHKFCCKKARY